MASTYTPLGVELQATGENAGTWGTKTNTDLQIINKFLVVLLHKLYLILVIQHYQFLMDQLGLLYLTEL